MRKVLALAVIMASTGAQAKWEDVEYAGSLPAEAVYCDGQGELDDFTAFVQDQDMQGAMAMIQSGDCAMTSSTMKIQVFQEEAAREYITFLAPSGKAFYTLKGYLQ